MRFSDIEGHEDVKRALISMCDSGRIAHAIMLHEDEGSGALSLALAFVQYLNCQDRMGEDACGVCPSCRKMEHLVHPDVHFIFPLGTGAAQKLTSSAFLGPWRKLVSENPCFTENELYPALGFEGKSSAITVAEAKFIIDTLSLSPVEDGYRAVIMWLPENMRTEAANKLLKSIEEPPEKTIFIFITHHPEQVLKTVSSRCLTIRVAPVPPKEGGELYEEFMPLFRELMLGIVARDLFAVLEVSEKISALESREKQKAFCIFAEDCIRNLFIYRAGAAGDVRVGTVDADFYNSIVPKCSPAFCEAAARQLDVSVMLLDRNVNAKIVFCDLVDRMFLSI